MRTVVWISINIHFIKNRLSRCKQRRTAAAAAAAVTAAAVTALCERCKSAQLRHRAGLGARDVALQVEFERQTLQVEFERQTLKPVFQLIGYRLWV
jgi:hypothetical protein